MQDAPQILTLLQEYSERTGHHCGLTVPQLMNRSGLPLAKVKVQLGTLYTEGKIKVREGIHGKLIFINQNQ